MRRGLRVLLSPMLSLFSELTFLHEGNPLFTGLIHEAKKYKSSAPPGSDVRSILKAMVKEDPQSLLPLCEGLFTDLLESNELYLVEDKESPDGLKLIADPSGIFMSALNDYKILSTPSSAEAIYNYRIERPLLFLQGALTQKRPFALSRDYGHTINVESPGEWLRLFMFECREPKIPMPQFKVDKFMLQFGEEAERIYQKHQAGEDVRDDLNKIIETVRKANSQHLAELIDLGWQNHLQPIGKVIY